MKNEIKITLTSPYNPLDKRTVKLVLSDEDYERNKEAILNLATWAPCKIKGVDIFHTTEWRDLPPQLNGDEP